MVALPYEAQDATEEILDHLFPPHEVLTAWTMARHGLAASTK